MAAIGQVQGMQQLLRKLEKLERESHRKYTGSVIVGYAASYALYVHEAIEGAARPPKSDAQRRAMFALIREREKVGHTPWKAGKPKFLENPAREMTNSGELSRVVRDAAKAGVPLVKALVLTGLRLQRASQKVVPVDTGNLRGSAFTAEE